MQTASLLVFLAACAGASTLAQDLTNITSTTPVAPAGRNASPSSHKAQIESSRTECTPPPGYVSWWYYNTRSDGPYLCYDKPTSRDFPFAMLNAYRSGGTQGVHWKYTDDPNDKECLENWIYWSADSSTSLAIVSGRTTFAGDSRRWCALPVYRSGGVQGKLWQNCACYNFCDSP